MNSVQYAEENSKGAYASAIGWITYDSDLKLANGQAQTVINSIPGGYTVQFDIAYTLAPVMEEDIIESFTAPVFGVDVPFGKSAYTGLNESYVVLYMPNTTPLHVNTLYTLNITNLKVLGPNGQQVSNYTIVAADAETTHNGEVWQGVTNGSGWLLIDMMASAEGTLINHPKIDGIGTQIVTALGIDTVDVNMQYISSPVYMTTAPTALTFNLTTDDSREGIALGIMLNQNIVPINGGNTTTTECLYVCPSEPRCYIVSSPVVNEGCTIHLLNPHQMANYRGIMWSGKLGVYYIRGNVIELCPYGHLKKDMSDTLVLQISVGVQSYTKQLIFTYDSLRCC